MDNTKTPVKTCKEAALAFCEAAVRSSYNVDRQAHFARMEILEMFGDMPLPAKFAEKWDLKI